MSSTTKYLRAVLKNGFDQDHSIDKREMRHASAADDSYSLWAERVAGQTVAEYEVLSILGSGGMGVVYKAFDVRLERMVALKFLSRDLCSDDEAVARFIKEAKVASALDHPNVATIYEINHTSAGHPFIAMAYYQGESLEKMIAREALPVEVAIDLAKQVGCGLSEAHANGFVHRDIKPANIMVTDDGIAKILDFGLAMEIGLTEMGRRMGTTSYMSPEQTRGEAVDHRTDIWSLGALLYEMVTGERPFKGDRKPTIVYEILCVDPPRLSTTNPGLAALELEHVVSMCLEKEKDLRYPSVSDLVSDLEHLQHRFRGRTDALGIKRIRKR